MSPYLDLRGVELGGKTLGLVGLGTIGSEVARLACAIGMKVLASDPYITHEHAAGAGAALTDLDTVLSGSDFVSVHLPTSPDAPSLIDRRALHLMGSNAYLINTSTPQAIDPTALLEALENGEIAGAALDVHESPPIPPNHPLLAHQTLY